MDASQPSPTTPDEPDVIIDLDDADEGAVRTPRRVMVCIGSRTEALNLVPVIRGLQAHPDLEPTVVLTGQSADLVNEILATFRIKPNVDLGLHHNGLTLDGLMTKAVSGFSHMIRESRPDAVVAQGDTTTTFAAALAASYAKAPFVHVGDGPRVPDTREQRGDAHHSLTTTLAALHLAATESCRTALIDDHVDANGIAVVGSPVIDAVRVVVRNVSDDWDSPVLRDAFDVPGSEDQLLVLVTAHRPETWGEPLRELARAIGHAAEARRDVRFVWPLHSNPAVRGMAAPIVAGIPNITITGPTGYRDSVRLLQRACAVVTDSGDVQEEARALGHPVLVTRDIAGPHDAVDRAGSVLVGTDEENVTTQLLRTLAANTDSEAVNMASPFGDGMAGRRMAAAVAELLGVGSRLPEFEGERVHALAG